MGTTNAVLYFVQHHDDRHRQQQQNSVDFDTPPVPLSHVYHATASRSLSTSLPITPANTITEIDSAYCPQCLVSWDASAAFSTAKGTCVKRSAGGEDVVVVGCVSCPECQAILKMDVLDEKCCAANDIVSSDKGDQFTHVCVYKCGYCQWDSTECGIYRTLQLNQETSPFLSNQDDDQSQQQKQGMYDEIVRVAMEELEQNLTMEIANRGNMTAFQALQSCWMERNAQLQKLRRRAGVLRKRSNAGTLDSAIGILDGSKDRLYIANEIDLQSLKQQEGTQHKLGVSQWDVEKLEETVERRRHQIASQVSKSISIGNESTKAPLLQKTRTIIVDNHNDYDDDDDDCFQILNDDLDDVEARQQLVGMTYHPTRSNIHLPIPVSLRARAERRCMREMEAGRPGILLKPKVNPLEGDTSLRYGHGQWWKKDSSAIHSIPRVYIKAVKYNVSTSQYALLLQIQNPTIGPIRLRIGTALEEHTKFPDSLEVIMDPLAFHKVNVNVISTHNFSTTRPIRMEQICLEAMEDVFLDVTKLNQQTPLDADDDGWVDWSNDGNTCTLVSEQNDVAWLRYVTESVTPMKEDLHIDEEDSTLYFGIPLKLEVEVSDDSWESSLIQVQEKTGNQKDFVTICTLAVWKHPQG